MDIIALAALVKAGKNDVTISQSGGLVELPIEIQASVTFEYAGETYTKVSDVAPDYDHLIGGKIDFGEFGDITFSDVNCADYSGELGQQACGWIIFPETPPMLFFINEAGATVSETGTYTLSPNDMENVSVYYYGEGSTATVTPHASFYGSTSMTSGETDLPDNVMYMQTNGTGTAIKNAYVGVNGKAARFELTPDIFTVHFAGGSPSGTSSTSSSMPLCDRSFSQILAAYDAGKDIRLKYDATWFALNEFTYVDLQLSIVKTNPGDGGTSTVVSFAGIYTETTYDADQQTWKNERYVKCVIDSNNVTTVWEKGFDPFNN